LKVLLFLTIPPEFIKSEIVGVVNALPYTSLLENSKIPVLLTVMLLPAAAILPSELLVGDKEFC
jgi:hypothetical protein